MFVLMIAAEFSPYAEAGPAAASLPALSRALVQLGHEVTVVLPKYQSFEEMGLLVARRLSPLELEGGGSATIFDGQLGSGVKLVLIDSPPLFEGAGVHSDDPGENARRFGFFAQAVGAFAQQRHQQGSPFDVVHAHDWPGALAVLQLKALQLPLPCMLTVQDAQHVGQFSDEALDSLRVPERFRNDSLRSAGGLCVLKAGVLAADVLTTSSPSMAKDLTDESRYGGLAVTFAERTASTTGILPGLDYARYNPATDSELAARFDAEHLANKGNCRTALLRQLNLDVEVARPLLALLVEGEAGAAQQILEPLCSELLRNELSLVVAGQGVESLALIPESARRNAAAIELSNPALERRLLAAADLALCLQATDGSSVRKAQRYAAVPLALNAGAAADAVVDCDADLETGTGFLFSSWSEAASAVQRGLAACQHPAWPRLQRRIARLDLSWDRVAHRYEKLYRKLQGQ